MDVYACVRSDSFRQPNTCEQINEKVGAMAAPDLAFVSGNRGKVLEMEAVFGAGVFEVMDIDLREIQASSAETIARAKAAAAFYAVNRREQARLGDTGCNLHVVVSMLLFQNWKSQTQHV